MPTNVSATAPQSHCTVAYTILGPHRLRWPRPPLCWVKIKCKQACPSAINGAKTGRIFLEHIELSRRDATVRSTI